MSHKEYPMNPSDTTSSGATGVITHHVHAGRESDYELWLDEIVPVCRSFEGHLDLQVIRPIAGLTMTYTVVIRFDTHDHLRLWLSSPERRRLIEKVRPLLAKDDKYTVQSGLEFWFTPPGTDVKAPVRWKQTLIAWSAIYPLVLVLPLGIAWILRRCGAPHNRFLLMLLVSGSITFLMTYVVMPRYTKLVRNWIYK